MPETAYPRQNQILDALSPAARERLLPHLQVEALPLGMVLYESGDMLRHIYFPTDSIVSLLYVMEDGASAEIAVVGNDGAIGVALFMGGETTTNLFAALVGLLGALGTTVVGISTGRQKALATSLGKQILETWKGAAYATVGLNISSPGLSAMLADQDSARPVLRGRAAGGGSRTGLPQLRLVDRARRGDLQRLHLRHPVSPAEVTLRTGG